MFGWHFDELFLAHPFCVVLFSVQFVDVLVDSALNGASEHENFLRLLWICQQKRRFDHWPNRLKLRDYFLALVVFSVF